MTQTPREKIKLVLAELQRCDELLRTLWHEDSRREVLNRRAAVVAVGEQIQDVTGEPFHAPAAPKHPRYANL
jgi:hypothetical protein